MVVVVRLREHKIIVVEDVCWKSSETTIFSRVWKCSYKFYWVDRASGEQTAFKASFAYGPVTLAAANSEYNVTGTASDQEVSSLKLSYTVSDAISIGYGTEEINLGSSATDAEYSIIKGSYTSGGMTISASMADGDNTSFGTGAGEDLEYWSLGLSFAF